jgi:hypothetical protein
VNSFVLTRYCRLEPDLYRTIVYAPMAIDGMPRIPLQADLLALLDSRRECFRMHTQNLFVGLLLRPAVLDTVLGMCENLKDIHFYGGRHYRMRIGVRFATHSLTHLTCSWAMLDLDVTEYTTSLTHLYITSAWSFSVRRRAWLASLPRLTHLAVSVLHLPGVEDWPLNPQLKCLVLLRLRHGRDPPLKTTDPRVFKWTVPHRADRGQDWQCGHVVANDMWARADSVIAARLRGEVVNPEDEPQCLVNWGTSADDISSTWWGAVWDSDLGT